MDIIETIDYKGYTINIHPDHDPLDPRDWDNLGTMVCFRQDSAGETSGSFHRRYNLGDDGNLFRNPEELQEFLAETPNVSLPLYLYDHSGITMSTRPFSCPWDSGQVGIIYVTHDDIRKEYSCDGEIPEHILELVENVLRGEVEVYDKYLTGSFVGYEILGFPDAEFVDSCWGFEDTAYAIENAKEIIDYEVKEDHRLVEKTVIEHAAELGFGV
jgi:hypothetical protein